jgi:hypothetical protein
MVVEVMRKWRRHSTIGLLGAGLTAAGATIA